MLYSPTRDLLIISVDEDSRRKRFLYRDSNWRWSVLPWSACSSGFLSSSANSAPGRVSSLFYSSRDSSFRDNFFGATGERAAGSSRRTSLWRVAPRALHPFKAAIIDPRKSPLLFNRIIFRAPRLFFTADKSAHRSGLLYPSSNGFELFFSSKIL